MERGKSIFNEVWVVSSLGVFFTAAYVNGRLQVKGQIWQAH